MIKNKESFTVKVDGKDKEFCVVKPGVEVMRKAQMEYNRVLNDAIESKAPFRKSLGQILIDRGIWSTEKQLKLIEMQTELNDSVLKLGNGGMKLYSEARKLAIRINSLRQSIRELITEQAEMDSMTAEGQAENAKFNYYVYACTLNDKGEQYFDSLDDYYKRWDEGSAVAQKAASLLGELLAGLDNNDDNLPEIQFLKKYNFIDEQGRFVKDGKFVDVEGNLVNEKGERINEKGQLVDSKGEVIKKEEPKPFLDEEGKEVK